MDDLESKSKNFSNNLTVEVDKHVDNIEEKVKQLKTLIDVLPNGQKNTPVIPKGKKILQMVHPGPKTAHLLFLFVARLL